MTAANVPFTATRSPVIMVVDDDDSTRHLLKVHVTKMNYEPVCFGDGLSALEWLGANPRPDLALLDVMLPDMDGYTVCTRIRERYSSGLLPVLMLSALGGDVEQRIRGLQVGANDILGKPFHSKELRARIDGLLKLHDEAQEADDLTAYVAPARRRRQTGLLAAVPQQYERGTGVVLFADLRGFTAFTAASNLDSVIDVLNTFFEAMMRVIEDHGGVVFDLIGDELLAVFNLPESVPQPAFLAVQAAVAMQHAFTNLHHRWELYGIHLGLGIGIHMGEVALGDIGGANYKRFTVIGSPVNIANRLVSNAHNGEIMISESVSLGTDRQRLPPLTMASDEIRLKGISDPFRVWRLRPVVAG
ncbi:MAG TPA: adenylate/guanylate cyclase domain-containing protein [Aggregatilineales bacterium]|nr:response regulator [Anaerolineales bacterium]HRE46949.1 adenylate/guanylate cyclase domain-containing protein [Aggregatilineales bacterium]